MINNNDLIYKLREDQQIDGQDESMNKITLKKFFKNVITVRINKGNIVYKIGHFETKKDAEFGKDFVYLLANKDSPIAARIGALLERFLFLGPFKWEDYCKFHYSVTTLTQVLYKNYPFKVYASIRACIRYLKKHYPQFIKDL